MSFPLDPSCSRLKSSTVAAPLRDADSYWYPGGSPIAPYLHALWGKVCHAPRNGTMCDYMWNGTVIGRASDGYFKVFRRTGTSYVTIPDAGTWVDDHSIPAKPEYWGLPDTISEVAVDTVFSLWEGIETGHPEGEILQGTGLSWLGGGHGIASWTTTENVLYSNTDAEVSYGTRYDGHNGAGAIVTTTWVLTTFQLGETFTAAMARAWALYEATPDIMTLGPYGQVYSRDDSGNIISGAAITNENCMENWPNPASAGTSGGSIVCDPALPNASGLHGCVCEVNEPAWYLQNDTYTFRDPPYPGAGIPGEIAATSYTVESPLTGSNVAINPTDPASGFVYSTAKVGTPPPLTPSLSSDNSGSTSDGIGLTSD